MGNRQTQFFFWENRQSGYSFLTRILYLAGGPIEKKVMAFLAKRPNMGGTAYKSQEIRHHLSAGFHVSLFVVRPSVVVLKFFFAHFRQPNSRAWRPLARVPSAHSLRSE